MTGTALRLGRLFRESGRSFVTAFDHGATLRMPMSGPGPREVLSAIVESGPDGVLLSAGMLATNADLFARRGAPVPVVRADWTVIDEASTSVGVPVLTLGGARGAADAVEAAARDAIAAGAKGLIFGRNVWAADDPITTTRNLLEIVHGAA